MTIVKADYGSIGARERHVPRGLANTHPIFVERAEGTRIWDTAGKEYLDFTSGIGVLNTGHRHPAVVRAVRDQLDRLMHTCFQVTMYEPYVELAARLSALVGSADTHKAVLFTTGAEAIENAVKIARAHTRRSGVIAFSGGFHGRSLLALTMTASSPAYRQNFGPFAADVYHAPYPDEYRGWTTARAIEALEELFSTEVMPEQIAAVVIEPELGEGGFIPAPAPFMQQLRAITRRHGIVLVADEVQSGFGRTGRMFGYQHAGIEPDLVVMAKSLAAGLPLSAVAGTAAIMDAPLPGGLGGTYGGNPLACASALAVLDIFDAEGLVARAAAIGEEIRAGAAPPSGARAADRRRARPRRDARDRDGHRSGDQGAGCRAGAAHHRSGARTRAAAVEMRAAQERGAAAAAVDRVARRDCGRRRAARSGGARRAAR